MTSLIQPALNLNLYHFRRTIRGIHCFGTWSEDGGQGGKQCLVLLDAMRPVVAYETMPVIIPERDAWRFAASDDPEVGDRAHAMRSINHWIDEGYLPNNMVAIMTAINECLRDLYNMPPKPVMAQVAFGDVIIKDRLSGSIIEEKEMTQDVQH